MEYCHTTTIANNYFSILIFILHTGAESLTITETLSALNLSLKLIKHLVCGPIIMQKKYPLLVVPSLECMVSFYYATLVEEFPHATQVRFDCVVLSVLCT